MSGTWAVRIGPVDVTAAVRSVRRTEDEDPDLNPTQIVLYRAYLADRPFDYLDEVQVDELTPLGPRRAFTGGISSAAPGATSLILNCLSGLELKGRSAGPVAYDKCGVDVIYSILRSSRDEEDGAGIDGLDSLPHERFSIAVPVVGLAVDLDQVALGDITLVARRHAAQLAEETNLSMSERIGRAFLESAETFAVAHISSFTMHDAQEEAVRRVDDLLALLTTISRFSHSSLPSGLMPRYSREASVFQCTRAPLVLVRGATTGRSWLRRSFDPDKAIALSPGNPPLNYLSETEFADSPPRSDALRMLVRFTARAAQMTVPTERVVTLWQALEFYAASTSVPEIFGDSAMRKIKYELRKHVRNSLSGQQNDRLSKAIGDLNNAPLMRRFAEQIHKDGVPISRAEMTTLKTLRDRRNEVIHGENMEPILKRDVDKGVALAARIALYALSRDGHQTRT